MKKQESHSLPARSWQMSFNDLLTILLTFFILYVSMSTIRADKIQGISESAAISFRTGSNRWDQRESLILSIGAVEGTKVHRIEGGLSIVLAESLLYRSGSADILNPEILRRIGRHLTTAGGSIRIEGHTDSIPVQNDQFPSNWELSTQRAVNVVKFLISECGIDPKRLSAAGYGDSRPLASNDTPEGRAVNRRVNINLSNQ